MKFNPSILSSAIIFSLVLSGSCFALTVNNNFNFSSPSEMSNGILGIRDNNVNLLTMTHLDNYSNSSGVVNFTNGGGYATVFMIYALDNSNSTIFKVGPGVTNVQIKINNLPESTPYQYNAGTIFIEIIDANNGTSYSRHNITPSEFTDTCFNNGNWCLWNVTHNFSSDSEVQIRVGLAWINSFGRLFTYVDYFLVTTDSCSPSIYCLNNFDYKNTGSSCNISYGSCSPNYCHNFLDYGLNNASYVVGIGCFDPETEQTTSCLNVNGTAINCKVLNPTISNPGDSLALAIGSLLGIRNLATAKAFSTIILAIIVSIVVGFITREEEELVGKLMILMFVSVLVGMTLIGWFPAWLMIVMIIISVGIVVLITGEIFK